MHGVNRLVHAGTRELAHNKYDATEAVCTFHEETNLVRLRKHVRGPVTCMRCLCEMARHTGEEWSWVTYYPMTEEEA